MRQKCVLLCDDLERISRSGFGSAERSGHTPLCSTIEHSGVQSVLGAHAVSGG
jgi:hypothetical protein